MLTLPEMLIASPQQLAEVHAQLTKSIACFRTTMDLDKNRYGLAAHEAQLAKLRMKEAKGEQELVEMVLFGTSRKHLRIARDELTSVAKGLDAADLGPVAGRIRDVVELLTFKGVQDGQS